MALITSAHYQTLLGEPAPAEFDLLQDHAIRILELYCGRPLESAWHTETVQVFSDGVAYPSATPVTDTTGEWTDTTIEGLSYGWQTISYEGGFGEYDDPNHPAPCPPQLAHAAAYAIHTLAQPVDQTLGAFSALKVGDYQVSVRDGQVIAADGLAVDGRLLPFASIGGRALSLASDFRRF